MFSYFEHLHEPVRRLMIPVPLLHERQNLATVFGGRVPNHSTHKHTCALLHACTHAHRYAFMHEIVVFSSHTTRRKFYALHSDTAINYDSDST